MNEKLPKVLKLKSNKQIETLFKVGNTIKAYPLILVYHEQPLEVDFKVGFSVSKRFFKKAVHRNFIKRLVRENFRKKKYIFTVDEEQFLLMFLYVGKELPTYQNIEKSLLKIEGKWQKKIKKNDEA